MGDEPCEKLQEHDKDEQSDDRQATATKNEKRENARNDSDDNDEYNAFGSIDWSVLKVLLRGNVAVENAACPRSVIEEVLNPDEHSAEQIDSCIRHHRVPRMLHALVGVIVKRLA